MSRGLNVHLVLNSIFLATDPKRIKTMSSILLWSNSRWASFDRLRRLSALAAHFPRRRGLLVLISFAFMLVVMLRCSAQTPGLVAAYGFNEGTGTTVSDASGHGITGTLNGATWSTGGKYGNALSFNGSSSYVDLGNPTSLQITGSMTWSAWVKAAANPADDGQIVAKSDGTSGWQLKTSTGSAL
jgi:hypothetical protein